MAWGSAHGRWVGGQSSARGWILREKVYFLPLAKRVQFPRPITRWQAYSAHRPQAVQRGILPETLATCEVVKTQGNSSWETFLKGTPAGVFNQVNLKSWIPLLPIISSEKWKVPHNQCLLTSSAHFSIGFLPCFFYWSLLLLQLFSPRLSFICLLNS